MTNESEIKSSNSQPPISTFWPRIRSATGTVYGDIGTSVLYTTMEITRETILLKHKHLGHEQTLALIQAGGDLITQDEKLGGLSLVIWALIFLTIKYDLLILRADHRGEGGTFALWGLLSGLRGKVFAGSMISFLVICASALLAADGIITPPISMLGAFEPLGASEPLGAWEPFWKNMPVVATLVCLAVLFKFQWRGTSSVGGFFGWFMILVWFPWIALKGLPWVFASPEVFLAINPMYAIKFLLDFPSLGALVILGVVVLAITGGEAKYADLGHFSQSHGKPVPEGESVAPRDSGRIPVMYSWFIVVMPSLLLCYAGQVGYLLENGVPPRANTFYAMTPQTSIPWIDNILRLVDMSIAAVAAIIASQALITGMFSIVRQAIGQGLLPRLRVFHTDKHGEGQVYIPAVNWALFIGCVIVTLVFQSAANLAAAYGVAVTGTMGVTTIIFSYVTFYRWRWSIWLTAAVCLPILVVDLTFFFSNLLKLASGGYVPLVIATGLVMLMMIWQWGRHLLGKAFYDFGVREGKRIEWLISLRELLDDLELTVKENLPAARQLIAGRRRLVESDRAAVFLCSRPVTSKDDYVPVVLRIFLKKYGVLPTQVVLMHVHQLSISHIPSVDKYTVDKLGNDIHSVVVRYGYMQQPDIRRALKELQRMGVLPVAAERWIIEVGEEDIIIEKNVRALKRLALIIFTWMLRLSTPAHKYMGVVYDAAVSKEVVPVVVSQNDAKVALPELELVQT